MLNLRNASFFTFLPYRDYVPSSVFAKTLKPMSLRIFSKKQYFSLPNPNLTPPNVNQRKKRDVLFFVSQQKRNFNLACSKKTKLQKKSILTEHFFSSWFICCLELCFSIFVSFVIFAFFWGAGKSNWFLFPKT
ncbi:hypothetical protein AB205_0212060 [Aquarana catesbeiana]|uniref:Uncharacterized protein n=1 Tax=Aquarana catesbeiana TaxID=8400 RepID=A0A2G9SFM8_AQUCT|nr:hypothetical protein AB205_0212060 [Aquarana catesbeiana]